MARYYFNRQQQNDWINLNALSKMAPYCGFTMNHSQKEMPKWDKEGDLHKINELANKEGWHFQACAGTMWFLDEVKQACVKYLEEKGFDVDIKNINVTSHIEGQYDDAREFIDGMEVTLTPGNETNNG